MEPVGVNSETFMNFSKENNYTDPKFNVGGYVRTSKYKCLFGKGCIPNWSEEVFLMKKIKNIVPRPYSIGDLRGEKVLTVGLIKKDIAIQKNTYFP